MDFLNSEAGKRAQKDGRALFEWVKLTLQEHSRAEALDLLLDKVMEEQMSLEALHVARGHAAGDSEVRGVLTDAIGALITIRPDHWK